MPDYSSLTEVLVIAENIVGAKPALKDFLEATAYVVSKPDGTKETTYRPYAAVMMLVGTDVNVVEELSGRRGIKFADRSSALKWLAMMQRVIDAQLGIEGILPTDSSTAPGPVFVAWR